MHEPTINYLISNDLLVHVELCFIFYAFDSGGGHFANMQMKNTTIFI